MPHTLMGIMIVCEDATQYFAGFFWEIIHYFFQICLLKFLYKYSKDKAEIVCVKSTNKTFEIC